MYKVLTKDAIFPRKHTMLHANIICIGHVFLPQALFVMLVTYLSSNMALLSKINTKVSLELKRQLRKLQE